MKVITSFGLSDTLQAGDGIDQGKVISPLIWRIFYDSLLHCIQNTTDYSYKMDLNISNISSSHINYTKCHTVSCMAYADDTGWIVRSKYGMQQILRIS